MRAWVRPGARFYSVLVCFDIACGKESLMASVDASRCELIDACDGCRRGMRDRPTVQTPHGFGGLDGRSQATRQMRGSGEGEVWWNYGTSRLLSVMMLSLMFLTS